MRTQAAPDSAAVRAVEAVCAEFDSKGEFLPLDAGRWIRHLRLTWGDGVQHVAFVLDSEALLLAVYVVLRLPNPADRRDALARAVTRANYGLLPGCFEVDLDGGETRYRSVLQPLPAEPGVRDVAQLLSAALVTAAAYAPAFQRVVLEGADPVQAVDDVEASD